MQSITDSELVARYAATNDQEAFRELHDRHHDDVLRFLLNQVQPHDARDLLQEVFICVMRKHDTYTPGANVGAWLISIARNRIRNFRRDGSRMKRCPESRLRTLSGPADGENRDIDVAAPEYSPEMMLQLREVVSRLTPEERAPVELVYFERMRGVDAAEYLGLPIGTFKSRMNRAMKKLRCWAEKDYALDVA